ncbi:hypothetical protein ACHAW5_003910 [Stephanodiscus triporus]|uniref:Uncharacterized protein n=1 Tax=Stephanodiscus triporus TaxID=2934178 RepID=A0ABD3MN36_9STRA
MINLEALESIMIRTSRLSAFLSSRILRSVKRTKCHPKKPSFKTKLLIDPVSSRSDPESFFEQEVDQYMHVIARPSDSFVMV